MCLSVRGWRVPRCQAGLFLSFLLSFHPLGVLFQDGVLDVLAELARDRIADGAEFVSLDERVCRVNDIEAVLALHDPQASHDELVVEYDFGKSLHAPEARAFLEGKNPYFGYCEAVEGLLGPGCFLDITFVVRRHDVLFLLLRDF